jgi:hypothetical protein
MCYYVRDDRTVQFVCVNLILRGSLSAMLDPRGPARPGAPHHKHLPGPIAIIPGPVARKPQTTWDWFIRNISAFARGSATLQLDLAWRDPDAAHAMRMHS